jgi:hypothetical protein
MVARVRKRLVKASSNREMAGNSRAGVEMVISIGKSLQMAII